MTTSEKHNWVKNVEDLRDFISYMVLYAPNEFPVEDYLEKHEQMNLEKAFKEVSRGLELIKEREPQAQIDVFEKIVKESKENYEAGNDIKGAHLLQELESLIFK